MMCGLHLFSSMMVLNIISSLLITSPNIFGFTNLNKNLKWRMFLYDLRPLLKTILPLKFKLYMDNSGKFITIANFIATNGISHLTTPPHTPEYNVYSERIHRHIVETRLSLSSHAFILLKFWPQSFATAVCLINKFPTPTLNLSTQLSSIVDIEPTTVIQALKNKKWHRAMSEEFDALI